jgi:isoamylase
MLKSIIMASITVHDGFPGLYGSVLTSEGVFFSIYSKSAKSISLILFSNENDKLPSKIIDFNPQKDKTGDIWHIFVKGLKAGALYLYKIDGSYDPPKGLRYNKAKYILDPYAKALTIGSIFDSYNLQRKSGTLNMKTGELSDLSNFPKCVVIDDKFDWENDLPLNYPLDKTIIYEMNLRGFTASKTSNVTENGTYKGLTQKIDYLKKLGITSVELLPIFEFDENENNNINPKTGAKLVNYWGYSTVAFFAPKSSYAHDKRPGQSVNEFKQMVKEMHKNGIEIILDVVFNHTAEGNEAGYTFSFRGIQNDVYYLLPKNEKQYYMNYSGCGNTVNCNHPVVTEFILNCLRYWVYEMHVDGFRFDLASILTRDQFSMPMDLPFLTNAINEDPLLSKTKIIAEPWDCGGVYQLGHFPGGNRWSEWNGRFRDDIRRFIRGDENVVTAAATRIAGSSDLFNHDKKSPLSSINFITAHDGFTLNDLVSYNYKHNDENGEDNRDGSDDNLSYNHGFEGFCTNPKIEALRLVKIKNFLVYLFVSQGVPMLTAGDEMRRTQNGNNNAYCQDNEIGWMNWDLEKKNEGLVRFTSKLIELRKNHNIFRRDSFFQNQNEKSDKQEISWYNFSGKNPEWSKTNRFLGFELKGLSCNFYVATNTDIYDLTINVPALQNNKKWFRVVDTSLNSPDDILDSGKEECILDQKKYVLLSNATIILMSK